MNPISDPDIEITGRNDPCPCGSGRKYKKCCLLAQQEQQVHNLAYESNLRMRHSVTDTIIRMAMKEQPEWEELILDVLFAGSDDAQIAFFDEDFDGRRFLSSVLQLAYIYGDTIESVPVWKYIAAKYARTFTNDEAAFLASLERAETGFYRIEEVFPSVGEAQVQNILTKRSLRLIDRGLSTSAVQHDIISGIVVPFIDDRYVLEGCPAVGFAPGDCDTVLTRIRAISGARSAAKMQAYLDAHPDEIFRIALDYFYMRASRPMPAVTTTDGDELSFSTSHFTVEDFAKLAGALDADPSLVQEERSDRSARYAWLNERDTLLGSVVIENGSMIFETNSDARLKKWKTKMKKLPLTFIETKHIDPETAMRENGGPVLSGSRLDTSAASDEELDALARDYIRKHYESWIVTPLPALGGKTPKQAAATASGRKQVSKLLDSMENMSLHSIREDPRSPQKYFDADELRRKLGL